jgi:hypothetical protein
MTYQYTQAMLYGPLLFVWQRPEEKKLGVGFFEVPALGWEFGNSEFVDTECY